MTSISITPEPPYNISVSVSPSYALELKIPGVQGSQGLKGDTGDQGPKGDTGDQGPKGDTGDQGPKGDTGDQGPKGDTGDQGPPGPGTVNSVGVSVPTGLSVSGSPVTDSGTISITYTPGYQGYTTVEAGTLATALQLGDVSVVAISNSYEDLDDTPGTATTSVEGLVELATAAEVISRAADRAITPDILPGAKAAVSLAYSSTRSLVWTDGWFRTCTLTGNMTLSNPSSVEAGDTIILRLIGNSATERSVAFGTNYTGALPEETVTSTSGLLITLFASTTTEIIVSYVVFEP